MAITYALMQRLEELVESDPDRVSVIKKAKVNSIKKDGNKVSGVNYEFNGENHSVDGVVVLATGGYAADFSENGLLKQHRPDTYNLSTTNGNHATGDGLKMLMEIGANGIDLDKVQVHPTGLVDPKDPGSKWKFLAAEGMSISVPRPRFWADLSKRSVAKAASSSIRRGSVSPTSLAIAITSPANSGKRKTPATGLSALCSTPKPPTSSTFILAITLVAV